MKMIVFWLALLLSLSQEGVPPKQGPYQVQIDQIHVGGYITGGSQDALVFYPNKANQGEKYPMVVFAHGKSCGGEHLIHYYKDINQDLASWGFIVVAPLSCPDKSCDYFDMDILWTLQAIPAHPELHPIFAQADFNNVGILGHSMGGVASVQVAAMEEALHYNLKAVSAFNPCVSYASKDLPKEIKVPMIFITGTLDDVCPGVEEAFDEDPINLKIVANIIGKGHNDIGDSHSQALNAYGIQFLNCELKGQGCEFFFYSLDNDFLCKNGDYTYERCEVDGKPSKVEID